VDLYRKALILGGFLLLSSPLPVSHAVVTTTITSDGTLGTTISQSGTLYNINGGTIKGSNLFQSFTLFSVGTGDIASFNGPNGIVNILSRVTGGQQSLIDGTLRSTISGANLYLLNPAGVLFGANARLDLSGSFHVSTADYLKFTDGAKFFVDLANANTVLSVEPVATFGFLGPNPAAITFQGSALSVDVGKTISVVGGDIKLEGGTPSVGPFRGATLTAQSGLISVAGVASAGEVFLSTLESAPNVNGDTFTALGSIELSQNSGIDISGNGGGTVLIRGGRLRIDSGRVLALNAGSGQSSEVQVTGDSLELSNGGRISTSTIGDGPGGAITVTVTGSISMDGMGSSLFSRTTQNGAAGSVTVTARTLGMTGGAQINTSADGAFGTNGPGGPVTVNATTISITGAGTGLFSNARAGSGRGGDISINAGTLTLTGGARIDSSTGHETNVPGVGTIISGSGPGGNVTITASDSVVLSDGAVISANSVAFGRAGNIVIQAGDSYESRDSSVTTATAQSAGGNISIQARRLVHLVNSEIITNVKGGFGNSGNITIDPQFVILDSSKIIASAIGGNGGNINITAGVFLASPDSIIDASSSLGISGTISIQAPLSNLSGALAPLPQEFLQVASLLSARCAARMSGKTSSFVLAGRDGLPPRPGGLLPSPLTSKAAAAFSAKELGKNDQASQVSPSKLSFGDEPRVRVLLALSSQRPAPDVLESECR